MSRKPRTSGAEIELRESIRARRTLGYMPRAYDTCEIELLRILQKL